MSERICQRSGCERQVKTRGLCASHYTAAWKRGELPPLDPRPTMEQRFWSKVNKTDDCWLWTGALAGTGYASFRVSTRLVRPAHIVAWELANGPVPVGLELDHLCRVRRCVNPAHLEPVTRLENVQRGEGHGSEQTCPNGHPYSAENTYRYVRPTGQIRLCRTCKIAAERRKRARSSVG